MSLPLCSVYRNERAVLGMLSFRQDFIILASREDRWLFSLDSCWEGNRTVAETNTWVSGYINILLSWQNNCICLDTLTICFHCLLLYVHGPQLHTFPQWENSVLRTLAFRRSFWTATVSCIALYAIIKLVFLSKPAEKNILKCQWRYIIGIMWKHLCMIPCPHHQTHYKTSTVESICSGQSPAYKWPLGWQDRESPFHAAEAFSYIPQGLNVAYN